MQIDSAAQAARTRLGPQVLGITDTILGAAVRAIIAAHPEPEKVRHYFDQYLGQMLAGRPFLGNPDAGIVARDFAASIFQDPQMRHTPPA